jgi:predicted nucleic acid-binding protein
VDLLVCSTAAHHGLVILHDDKDFTTAAQYLSDMRVRTIYNSPPAA